MLGITFDDGGKGTDVAEILAFFVKWLEIKRPFYSGSKQSKKLLIM
tara:strand:+ start:510 stop:647 length:138 start_codon:yes stop_codon:yes gene_type:complete